MAHVHVTTVSNHYSHCPGSWVRSPQLGVLGTQAPYTHREGDSMEWLLGQWLPSPQVSALHPQSRSAGNPGAEHASVLA